MVGRRSAPELLGTELVALAGLWLEVRCSSCGVHTSYPLRLLLTQRPALGSRPLADVVARLRCRRCRAIPEHVGITDDPAAGARGGNPATWTVALVVPK